MWKGGEIMKKTLIGEKDKGLNTIESRSGATVRGFCGCGNYCPCGSYHKGPKSTSDGGRIMVMLIEPSYPQP